MANTSAKHADEYRRECADHVITSGKRIADVARDPGIDQKTLQRRARKRRGQLDGGAPEQEEPAELRAARRRIRELERENESLKKASAFFAANQA